MIDFRKSKEPTNPLWEYIISVNLLTSSIWQIPYLVYSPSRLQLISSKTAFTRTSFWTTLILLFCLLQEVARNWSLKGGLTSDYVDNNVANKEKKMRVVCVTHFRNALGLKNTSFSTYIVGKFNTLCVKNISSYRIENQIIRLKAFPEKAVWVSSASKAQKQMANT